MANSKQAKKRARQNETRRLRNASKRTMLRTYIKNVRKALAVGDVENARLAFQAAVPVIDRMASKGIVHRNTAARYKSRLNARVKALSLQAA